MRRRKMSGKSSRKLFKKTANRYHNRNKSRRVMMRGGTRL